MSPVEDSQKRGNVRCGESQAPHSNGSSIRLEGNIMTLTAYNQVPIPTFMYGTAWKKEATKELVQLAVTSGFTAIDTANQLIHYEEALVGEALQALEKKGIKRGTLCFQTKF